MCTCIVELYRQTHNHCVPGAVCRLSAVRSLRFAYTVEPLFDGHFEGCREVIQIDTQQRKPLSFCLLFSRL